MLMKRLKFISLLSALLALTLISNSVISAEIKNVETPTDNVSGENIFFDWNKDNLTLAQIMGYSSDHSTCIKNTHDMVSEENGILTIDTLSYRFDSEMVQVEYSLDETTVTKAINAAKSSDGMLRFSIKVDEATSSLTDYAKIKFKMYCFSNGDWQHSQVLIAEGKTCVSASNGEVEFNCPVANLEDIIPEKIAINFYNYYYQDGLTSLKCSLSAITAGGQQATHTTTQADTSRFRKVQFEDYGDLIDHNLLGDLNADNTVNTSELLPLKKLIAKWDVDAKTIAADVFEDGKVDARDLFQEYLVIAEQAKTVHRPVTTDGNKNYNTYHEKTTDNTYIINDKEYKLIFNDEFEGTKLDTSKWEYCPDQERCGGDCVWRKDMVALDGEGSAVLSVAVDEDDPTRAKSGAIRTRGKFYNSYGYYECRALLQQYSKRFWGAFWLMPNNIDNGTDGGSDGTEIDIFESAYLGQDKVQQGIHFDGYSDRHKNIGDRIYSKNCYLGYHTYGFEWSPEGYKFYIDGKLSYSLDQGAKYNGVEVDVAKVANYLKLSVETSKGWTGVFKPEDTPNNIDGFTVDYVRVYKPVN